MMEMEDDEPMEQKVYLGQTVIVNYRPPERHLGGAWVDNGFPLEMAAVVTHVWSDNCVNLHIFPDGTYLPSGTCLTSSMKGDGENEWQFIG